MAAHRGLAGDDVNGCEHDRQHAPLAPDPEGIERGVPSTGRERSDRDAGVSGALRAAMDDVGASLEVLTRAWGHASRHTAAEVVGGERPLRWWHVRAMPLGLRIRLLERLLDEARAERDGRFPALPLDTHVRRVARTGGELAAVADDALADGRIDERERAQLAKAGMRLLTTAEHVVRDFGGWRAEGGGRR